MTPLRHYGALALLLCISLCANAQKWKYDFVVPDNGNFRQAINAANTRADKNRRYRIFVRASNYRLGNVVTTLTAPNTSIIGEVCQGTQVESCPQEEGFDRTSTLYLCGADSTYIQDIELWSNFRNDPTVFARCAVTLREQNCHGTILKNISLLGTQNTYYTNNSTTYIEDSRLCGTVDFICGSSTVYIDHCELRLMDRGNADNQAVICAPSTPPSARYGFVFSDCFVTGPQHQDGRYLLARPWNNAPRAAFLNCCMDITPAPEAWGDKGEVAPAQFAEFECTNRTFELLDTSARRTTFARQTGNPQPMQQPSVLSADAAENFVAHRVFNAWTPQSKSEQVPPPVVTRQGRQLTWKDIPEAGCYAICRDRKVVAFTTEPRYTIPTGTREGTVFSVRCANQMGGLGLRSAEVTYSAR